MERQILSPSYSASLCSLIYFYTSSERRNLSILFIDTESWIKSPKKIGAQMSGPRIMLKSTSDATPISYLRQLPRPMNVAKVVTGSMLGKRQIKKTSRAVARPRIRRAYISRSLHLQILSKKFSCHEYNLIILMLLIASVVTFILASLLFIDLFCTLRRNRPTKKLATKASRNTPTPAKKLKPNTQKHIANAVTKMKGIWITFEIQQLIQKSL